MLADNLEVMVALAVLATAYLVLWRLLWGSQDAQEPPLVEHTIPFLTPLLGLSKGHPGYFPGLRQRYSNLRDSPCFTIRIPFSRFYVINSWELVSLIQRKSRVFSFQAVTDAFAGKICDLSDTAKNVLQNEAQAWGESDRGTENPNHAAFKTLLPGEGQDEMKRAVIKRLLQAAEDWVPNGQRSETVKLYDWVKREITIATTDGIYGEQNPYRDPSVRSSFWTYADGLQKLVSPLPWLFARPILKARAHLAQVFTAYFQAEQHLHGSAFIRHRAAHYLSRGFPQRDLASLEAGNGIAILANTTPTAFWAAYYILSDPAARDACRAEILSHVSDAVDGGGNRVRTLDTTALKTGCPLLLSAFREAMRLHSTGLGLRMALEDHVVGGFLLKKGSTVFMPAAVQHQDPRWGARPGAFDYARFATTAARKDLFLFRAFGGGSTLCPGRDFATMTIVMFIAMVLVRFEVRPRAGRWEEPGTRGAGMTTVMPGPDEDVEVEIRRRREDEGVRWVWKVSEDRGHAIQGVEEGDGDGKGE